ncbi:hypothetical protein M3223_02540 [Paenibacillus pasadenensis]|uniref:hypothetical protein n=1 Tax=Paenibacillus pasadenensis TaxID=217090 RepID=UPI00203D31AB|nr:hypothetical protein [Paenibacillus pasadenensis]MCM3746228.1 hypothetical protein [Paenibacillus pasadenensis]
MELGSEGQFSYRGQDYRVQTETGKVIKADKVTLDGLHMIEVQFRDNSIRRYSLAHLR